MICCTTLRCWMKKTCALKESHAVHAARMLQLLACSWSYFSYWLLLSQKERWFTLFFMTYDVRSGIAQACTERIVFPDCAPSSNTYYDGWLYQIFLWGINYRRWDQAVMHRAQLTNWVVKSSCVFTIRANILRFLDLEGVPPTSHTLLEYLTILRGEVARRPGGDYFEERGQ